MPPQAHLNHIAILVPSVTQSSKVTEAFGFSNGPVEAFEGEGTLEMYVGEPSKSGLLLLMEATREGAYKRAFQKRGPGLHHIAVDVLDLEQYILQLSESGWLLHPKSLETIKATQTAYLARPGIPTLIELQQRDTLSEKHTFISRVEIPVLAEQKKMLKALGISQLHPSSDSKVWLTCDEKRLAADQLF